MVEFEFITELRTPFLVFGLKAIDDASPAVMCTQDLVLFLIVGMIVLQFWINELVYLLLLDLVWGCYDMAFGGEFIGYSLKFLLGICQELGVACFNNTKTV